MNSNFRTGQLKDQLLKLAKTFSWLKDLNIQFTQSRIIVYNKHLEELINAIDKNEVSQLLTKYADFTLMNSIFEAYTLNLIFDGFNAINPTKGLTDRLNEMVLGPVNVKSEIDKPSSHKGRDTSFELILASIFQRVGYDINFETTADLIAIKNSIAIVVECKRPRETKSLKNVINKADKQLSKRYKHLQFDNLYGLLAISIDMVVNPEHRYLRVSDPNSIDAVLGEESKLFVTNNKHLWRPPRNPRTIGMLGIFRTIAIIDNPYVVTNCNYLTGNNVHEPNTFETNLFNSIAKDLEIALLQGNLTSRST